MNKSTLGAAGIVLLALVSMIWAVPLRRAAHLHERVTKNSGRAGKILDSGAAAAEDRYGTKPVLPAPVRFRASEGRGLLISAWVNGAGEYTFAVDTGAGSTILSERIAREARVSFNGKRATISGLSGAGAVNGREAVLSSLAIGSRDNFLPSGSPVIVTSGLPPGVDGVLDPTDSYWPLGYSIDMPKGEMRAFDPRVNPLSQDDAPADGAVVTWHFDGHSRRPFVMLDIGRRALLDTGSGFGLAISESVARTSGIVAVEGRDRDGVRDLGGGTISARRIPPVTVRIGALTLRRVPTDLVSGVQSGTPILLGREALQPFHLTFDPINRLIRIAAE